MSHSSARHADLSTHLAGLRLRNPLILAAGTAGYVDELADVLDLSRVGAVVTKSITPEPREGNPTWRIIEHPAGMLNAIGLANVGVERFISEIGPRIAASPTPIIGSVAGFSIEDYLQVAAAMNGIDALAAVELNVSCPNVRGGVEFGADAGALRELVAAVRPVLSRKRLLVKLSPVAIAPPGTTIVDLARAAIDPAASAPRAPHGPNARPGADALSIANTIPAMAIDVRTRRPRLANVTGGLSGPAIHAVAVKLVHDAFRGVARDTATPIVGIGGVTSWQDAAEFILAGAAAVGLGTALFADPRAPLRIAHGVQKWLGRQGFAGVAQAVGAVELER